jgi:hypothetical protein
MSPRRGCLALYLAFGLALCGAYALAEGTRVWRPKPVLHAVVSPTVRVPPGSQGGGSGTFWHSGSHGGK